jgi:hypothetical protein
MVQNTCTVAWNRHRVSEAAAARTTDVSVKGIMAKLMSFPVSGNQPVPRIGASAMAIESWTAASKRS